MTSNTSLENLYPSMKVDKEDNDNSGLLPGEDIYSGWGRVCYEKKQECDEEVYEMYQDFHNRYLECIKTYPEDKEDIDKVIDEFNDSYLTIDTNGYLYVHFLNKELDFVLEIINKHR